MSEEPVVATNESKDTAKSPRVKETRHALWSPETLTEIKYKAECGKHRIRGCGTPRPFPNFDDLLVLPSQLTRMSIDTYREPCETRTVLGGRYCSEPLVIETPIMISGMSYGALSKEAKTALAKATQLVGTSINNGEGGLLPEERDNSYKQVVQILPSRFGFSLRSIEAADALELIVGIGAKPGLSGHLMGSKISKEVAEFRQLPEGIDLHSHPRHGDIFGADDMVIKIEQLREVTDNRVPIFIKVAAGRVAEDVKIAAKAGADGVVIDGAQAGTGAAPVVAANHLGIPTMPALVQAVRSLEDANLKDEMSIIVSGGIKDGADVAKALAIGADAVALGQSVMIAMGCVACMRCQEGKCAFGIGTQDPEKRKKLDVDQAAQRVANYITAMTNEAIIIAKAAGKTKLRNMEREDLRAMTLEACAMTGIPLVGSNYVFGEQFGFC